MKIIDTLDALETLYGAPSQLSLTKVATRLTPLYRKWIDASRFVVLTTVGPEGTDGSPRGDDGPVVRIADDSTMHLPDWQGNNRLDSLKNIVTDGRVSLMFMVPGSTNVVRVNGTAVIADDPAITGTFERKGMHPKTVIVVTVAETYFQCAKAVMRSGIWTRDDTDGLPTAGQFLKEMEASFDADGYDSAYPDYAKTKMW
ncbi:pyridoxamine 5'-phosphate oxidase family protein [Marivivens marinus]|uniref:pyridoxamine 5'-phosphate oxidase family protein n=1 Tax=Marivivens marinus TaxID=3110173 RepID=UPI003B846DFD